MKKILTLCWVLSAIQLFSQNHPFPQHITYSTGTIQPTTHTQTQLDSLTSDFYDQWKVAYLNNSCGSNQYYVEHSPNTNVSEGTGYGMMITAIMAGYDPLAQTYFDGLYNFYKAHPSNINNNLMAWNQLNCVSVNGVDAASDGDIDIAYGLLLADEQWGSAGTVNYLAEAQNIIAAIMQDEINPSTWTVKLGDWATSGNSYYYGTRGSDFITDHFRSFECASADTNWTNVINTCYNLVADMQANHSVTTGLIPDFIINTNTTPSPASGNYLESQYDGDYYYNSCRVPWRLGTDYLLHNESRAKTATDKITNWLKSTTNGNTSNLSNGYLLDGTAIFGWSDPAYLAPWTVAAMSDASHQTWLDALFTDVINTNFSSMGYYENSIKMMSMITISRNYWSPSCATIPMPIANFTATPTTGNASLLVNFDASTSTDPNGATLTYTWDFGDGNTGTGVTTSHTYTNGGIYTATLTVTNPSSGTDMTSMNITVNNQNPLPPVVQITSHNTGDTIYSSAINLIANATDTDGTIISVDFQIGGTTLSATNTNGDNYQATWTPSTTGNYTITATTTDHEGLTNTHTISVYVSLGLSVVWNMTNDWGTGYCADVIIHNDGTNPVVNWVMDFNLNGNIYTHWNTVLSNPTMDTYSAANETWNGTIGSGDSVLWGYCAYYTSVLPIPTDATINGLPVAINGVGSVSTKNQLNLTIFKLFPNPAQNHLTVVYELKEAMQVGIVIRDALGRVVLQKDMEMKKRVTQGINVDDLKSGVYILQLVTDKGIQSKRFLLTK